MAIVGTRRASRDGLEVARALGRDLALAGVPVVSGMALGIDAAAQTRRARRRRAQRRGAGRRAPTSPYPRSKQRAPRGACVDRGLVRLRAAAGHRAAGAGRSRRATASSPGSRDLTVVVEAAERSGSLITAELALKLGRDVAAVPGPVTSPDQPRGRTRCCATARAARARRAGRPRRAVRRRRRARGARRAAARASSPHLAELLDAVAGGPRHRRRARRRQRAGGDRGARSASPSSSCAASCAARPAGATRWRCERTVRTVHAPRAASPSSSRSPARTPAAAPGSRPTSRRSPRAGVHGTTAITAITVQNTVGVTGVAPGPARRDRQAQVRAVVEDLGVDAVKIGMLGDAATIRAVAEVLDELPAGTPVVLDPVMVAESGARLLASEAERALVERARPARHRRDPERPRGPRAHRALDEAADAEQLVRARPRAGPAGRRGHRRAPRGGDRPRVRRRRAHRDPPASATPTAPRTAPAARTRARSRRGSPSATTR